MTKYTKATIQPLDFSGQAYMDAHLNFRNNLTNQGQLMEDALYEAIVERIRLRGLTSLRIASIGSGTGIIDAPLTKRLSEHVPVTYVGIEPNAHEIQMAQDKFRALGVSDTTFYKQLIEDFDVEKSADFDVVILVHVTYYSSDISKMIAAADRMVGDDGLVLTIASANNPQNNLFVETTQAIHGHTPVLADDYRKAISKLGHETKTSTINARILMQDYVADPFSDASWHFLDFFLHATSRTIPDELITRYRQTIADAVIDSPEGKILPHIATLVASERA